MFIEVLIISIIIGYMIGGSVKNIDSSKIRGIFLVLLAFMIEFIIVILIRKHLIQRGIITFVLDFTMYSLIFIFTYINRRNKWIVLMGIGFLLNALPIFLNGGAMPVSADAVVNAELAKSLNDVKVSVEGLYVVKNSSTRLWFLGDIIPKPGIKPFFRAAVVSIGDIIAAFGLLFFIITEMRRK